MPPHKQYFEILGLDAPPSDRKEVKRAYSKMLKVTRPEDDPTGFMALRDAHDQALNILRWQVEDAAYEAQQVETPRAAQPDIQNTALETDAASSLTYSDMLPEGPSTLEPESDTSYAIGPTPNFDAPVTIFEPPAPKTPPLIADLNALLDDPKHYNDREQWNILFRKARQLDIDDYVDFEDLLMEHILRFHGYYEDHPLHDTPEKMHQRFSPSIAASLFKTMNWDQVSKHGYHRAQQIDWLERRMSLRKRGVDPVPVPTSDSGGSGNVWLWLIGAFILLKIVQALANGL